MKNIRARTLFVRVLTTLALLYTAIACLILPAAFSFLPPIFLLLCVLAFVVLVFMGFAVKQLWTRPKFSLLVWLALMPFAFLVAYPIGKFGFETLSNRDLVNPIVNGTRTIEISRLGYARPNDAILALSYVFDVGFDTVDISGKRYLKIEPDGYLLKQRASNEDKPQYLVVDQVVKPNVDHSAIWPRRGDMKIVVIDRSNNKEIGVWNGPGPGWPGPQAAMFIQNVLKPGKVGIDGKRNYQKVFAGIIPLTATDTLEPSYLTNPISNCPPNYSVVIHGDSVFTQIKTSDWIFGKSAIVKGVVCTSEGVFVFSNEGWNTVRMDWLSPTGKIITQVSFDLDSPELPKSSTFNKYVSVIRDGNKLSIRYAYFSYAGPLTAAIIADKEYDIVVPIELKAL
ncbi:MAG TPA: hypothetical protein VIF82_14595 [Burkholderiaceae bacterium]|jgi:energy-coupling factor transporter transmembrane protein EcfT